MRRSGSFRIAPIQIPLRRLLVPVAVFAFATEAKVLHIGAVGEPETLDPHRYDLRLEETILNDLFTGLTAFNAGGEIVPGVAEQWTTSEDGLTWTFELRTDARWSDGHPLTAHDFLYGFRRLLNPRTAARRAHFLYPIDNAEAVHAGEFAADDLGIRATSDHTLVVQLAQPFPFLPERLTYAAAYPVPAHVIEALGDAWVEPRAMVSNGAFTLEDWQPRGFVLLARNPAFHDAGSVALEGVAYHLASDARAVYDRYRARQFDAISDFPASEMQWVREHLPDHLRMSPLLSMTCLVFNVTEPPFDDIRVREALSISLDRQGLAERVLQGAQIASVSLVPPTVTGYESAVAVIKDPSARLDRARQLLRDAGYGEGNPLAVTLHHPAGDEWRAVNAAIAGMWREIDVTTTLEETEPKDHFARLRQGEFQIAQAEWSGENNPQHYLDLLASDIRAVASDTWDTLMRRAYAEPVLARRLDLLRDAEVVGLGAFAVAPLYSESARALVDPRIGGWIGNSRNVHGARYLSWNDVPGAGQDNAPE